MEPLDKKTSDTLAEFVRLHDALNAAAQLACGLDGEFAYLRDGLEQRLRALAEHLAPRVFH